MNTCPNIAAFRYSWPGRNDTPGICLEHARKLVAIAAALGMYVPLVMIDADEEITCTQEVSDAIT